MSLLMQPKAQQPSLAFRLHIRTIVVFSMTQPSTQSYLFQY